MISEEDRYDMHRGLEEALGSKRAATLMEHLPPVGWADVATKRDLEMLHLSMRADLANGLRSNLQWMITTQLAVAGMIIAAIKI
jgi:hypothetical protein